MTEGQQPGQLLPEYRPGFDFFRVWFGIAWGQCDQRTVETALTDGVDQLPRRRGRDLKPDVRPLLMEAGERQGERAGGGRRATVHPIEPMRSTPVGAAGLRTCWASSARFRSRSA